MGVEAFSDIEDASKTHQSARSCYYVGSRSTCLRVFDPKGVKYRSQHRLRRRIYKCKGPNYFWLINGYDKLKPFGFCN